MQTVTPTDENNQIGTLGVPPHSVDGVLASTQLVRMPNESITDLRMILEESTRKAHLTDRIMPSLLVHNLEETLLFYQDVLGFSVNDLESEGYGPSWAIVSRDGVAIQFFSHTHHSIPAVPTFSGMLRLFTEDIDALLVELNGMTDVEWTESQSDGRSCEVAIRDPNGYILTFCAAS